MKSTRQAEKDIFDEIILMDTDYEDDYPEVERIRLESNTNNNFKNRVKQFHLLPDQAYVILMNDSEESRQSNDIKNNNAYRKKSGSNINNSFANNRAFFDRVIFVIKDLVSDENSIKCPICLERPIIPKVTICGHVFCYKCIVHYFMVPTLSSDSTNQTHSCPICHTCLLRSDIKSVLWRRITAPEKNHIHEFDLFAIDKKNENNIVKVDPIKFEKLQNSAKNGISNETYIRMKLDQAFKIISYITNKEDNILDIKKFYDDILESLLNSESSFNGRIGCKIENSSCSSKNFSNDSVDQTLASIDSIDHTNLINNFVDKTTPSFESTDETKHTVHTEKEFKIFHPTDRSSNSYMLDYNDGKSIESAIISTDILNSNINQSTDSIFETIDIEKNTESKIILNVENEDHSKNENRINNFSKNDSMTLLNNIDNRLTKLDIRDKRSDNDNTLIEKSSKNVDSVNTITSNNCNYKNKLYAYDNKVKNNSSDYVNKLQNSLENLSDDPKKTSLSDDTNQSNFKKKSNQNINEDVFSKNNCAHLDETPSLDEFTRNEDISTVTQKISTKNGIRNNNRIARSSGSDHFKWSLNRSISPKNSAKTKRYTYGVKFNDTLSANANYKCDDEFVGRFDDCSSIASDINFKSCRNKIVANRIPSKNDTYKLSKNKFFENKWLNLISKFEPNMNFEQQIELLHEFFTIFDHFDSINYEEYSISDQSQNSNEIYMKKMIDSIEKTILDNFKSVIAEIEKNISIKEDKNFICGEISEQNIYARKIDGKYINLSRILSNSQDIGSNFIVMDESFDRLSKYPYEGQVIPLSLDSFSKTIYDSEIANFTNIMCSPNIETEELVFYMEAFEHLNESIKVFENFCKPESSVKATNKKLNNAHSCQVMNSSKLLDRVGVNPGSSVSSRAFDDERIENSTSMHKNSVNRNKKCNSNGYNHSKTQRCTKNKNLNSNGFEKNSKTKFRSRENSSSTNHNCSDSNKRKIVSEANFSYDDRKTSNSVCNIDSNNRSIFDGNDIVQTGVGISHHNYCCEHDDMIECHTDIGKIECCNKDCNLSSDEEIQHNLSSNIGTYLNKKADLFYFYKNAQYHSLLLDQTNFTLLKSFVYIVFSIVDCLFKYEFGFSIKSLIHRSGLNLNSFLMLLMPSKIKGQFVSAKSVDFSELGNSNHLWEKICTSRSANFVSVELLEPKMNIFVDEANTISSAVDNKCDKEILSKLSSVCSSGDQDQVQISPDFSNSTDDKTLDYTYFKEYPTLESKGFDMKGNFFDDFPSFD